jgi:hypothetical protein
LNDAAVAVEHLDVAEWSEWSHEFVEGQLRKLGAILFGFRGFNLEQLTVVVEQALIEEVERLDEETPSRD